MPAILLLVEESIELPLDVLSSVRNVMLPYGSVVGGLLKGVSVNEKGELLAVVNMLMTMMMMLVPAV